MRDHASIPHTTALEAFKRARDRQLSWIDGEKLLHQLLQTGVDRSEEVVKWSLQHHFFGIEPRKSYVMQGKAALTSGGHFDLSGCACLHFYCRDMTCNALPLSARHPYPGIGPTFMIIHGLSRSISALGSGATRRYGRIAKYRDFHIFVLHAFILALFCIGQRLGLAADLPIAPCADELVGQ